MNRSRRTTIAAWVAIFGGVASVAVLAGVVWLALGAWPPSHRAAAAVEPPFTPPDEAAIPSGPFGDMVREGERIFTNTAHAAPQFVGNDLTCSNCHLQAGRLAGASPLWAAYTAYPAYRSKNGHVNSFAERLQECFKYSMNGAAPPLDSPVLAALESYSFFLARGLPTGEPAPGRGFPTLPTPPEPADATRGAAVYAQYCASCHGAQGGGQISGNHGVIPPLWGPRAYNWGAGMASIEKAAAFIHANMPLARGNTLGVQQAWDVALFIDSRVRPQDPRFTGDVAATRALFHNTPSSMYGRSVDGAVLGDPAATPPFGTVAEPAK